MVRAVVVGVLLFVVAMLSGMQVGGDGVDLFGLIVLALLVNLTAAMWAAGVAMRLRTIQAGPAMQMPVFIILFLAPVYVPLEPARRVGPRRWRKLNPFTALIEGGRDLISGQSFDAAAGLRRRARAARGASRASRPCRAHHAGAAGAAEASVAARPAGTVTVIVVPAFRRLRTSVLSEIVAARVALRVGLARAALLALRLDRRAARDALDLDAEAGVAALGAEVVGERDDDPASSDRAARGRRRGGGAAGERRQRRRTPVPLEIVQETRSSSPPSPTRRQ